MGGKDPFNPQTGSSLPHGQQPESLLWSINLGCIEVHPWLSRKNALNHPTYIVIDLDPMPPADFRAATQVSLAFKSLLDHLKLAAFPKISGATGIHLYLPIKPVYTFKQTSAFVKRLGEAVIGVLPHLATNERKIERREGKVYIDHLQNSKGKTIAAVYSCGLPRHSGLHAVSWEELPSVRPQVFSVHRPRLSKGRRRSLRACAQPGQASTELLT